MIDSPVALVLVLGAIIAAPMLLRRAQRGSGEALRVLARTGVTKGSVIAVVAVDDRRMLIGASDRGVELLTELGSAHPNTDSTVTTTDGGGTTVTGSPAGLGDRTTEPGADARMALAAAASIDTGPGIGLVDRLRAMTVRTPTTGRPIRAPFRR